MDTAGSVTHQEAANDSLLSPQFILAIYLITIVAIVLGAVLWRGDAAQINLVLGFVFGVGVTVCGFFYGSSKSSQAKDAVIAAMPPTTTTVTVPPATVTTTTQGAG